MSLFLSLKFNELSSLKKEVPQGTTFT